MKSGTSRRDFIAAGLSLPMAGLAAQSLDYRVLGKTGLRPTALGFGCMITSDPSVIARGLDMGINYFDTARTYQGGNNERMVGAALKGSRDKIILSTKSPAKTGQQALEHLDTSLKTLGTDHVDIWYMHMRDRPEQLTDDLVAAWESAKKQGKIRFIGISTHDPNVMVDRVLEVGKVEVVLSTYNFTMGKTRDTTFERLHKAGIGLVAMKALAPAGAGKASKEPQMQASGAPLAAIKWVIKNPLFTTTLASMTDMDQLEMNFRAMAEKYGAEDEKILARLDEKIRPYYCRMCYGCSGQCPQGVPVPATLRYLAYADFYGQFALGREHFLTLSEQVRNVRCGDCSSCPIQCPNGVHVRERLTRAQELFG